MKLILNNKYIYKYIYDFYEFCWLLGELNMLSQILEHLWGHNKTIWKIQIWVLMLLNALKSLHSLAGVYNP